MPAHPLPGRGIAINSAGQHVQATVSDRRKFRLWLPPDTYRLIGYSPRFTVNQAEMQCGAVHLVHVTAGRVISHVRVICSPLAHRLSHALPCPLRARLDGN